MAEFIFEGSLADNPLPEVLQKIYCYKVPGVLTASNGAGSKQLFISGGEVIFASSTFADDRLGEFLLRKGAITQDQYDQSVKLLKETGKRQGAIFVEMGALAPRDLYRLVKEQVIAIVWSLFNWPEGNISFRVGKFKEDEIIKLNLDTRTVIMEGIKMIEDPKRIVRWLGRKEDVFEPAANALSLLSTLGLSPEDKKIFRAVDGTRNFLDILKASPLESGLTAKTLYAMYVLGLIQKKDSAIRIIARGGAS
ncbi:MAG: DUF4388 domain-containing protein [Acidobacteria bacterium]|jgi:hypothetical protein|nr:DUF4388 domain-containing protein [Acidobacteriota bacterium]